MYAHFKIAAIALCGTLLALPAAAQSPIRNLHVELGTAVSDFAVLPTELTLKAGEQYRLVLVNWSQGFRHLMMGPEFQRAVTIKTIRTYPERTEMAGASFGNGINVPPGERVEMYFVPHKEGSYKLFCQDRIHTDAGMELTINVRL